MSGRRARKKKLRETYYEVQDLLARRVLPDGRIECLVHWKGYSSYFDSWEPLESLTTDLQQVGTTRMFDSSVYDCGARKDLKDILPKHARQPRKSKRMDDKSVAANRVKKEDTEEVEKTGITTEEMMFLAAFGKN